MMKKQVQDREAEKQRRIRRFDNNKKRRTAEDKGTPHRVLLEQQELREIRATLRNMGF